MSLFQRKQVACPACGEPMPFDVIYSVNADRRPQLRQDILDGAFQQSQCPKCQAFFRLGPELSYLDLENKLWLLVQPIDNLPQWRNLELQAQSTFDKAYGPTRPRLARDIAANLKVRVTFGWAALREKIICAQAGLSDVDLELLKLALIRASPQVPLGDDVELRMAYVEGDDIWFAWIRAGEDNMLEMISAPRSLYDMIAADRGPWQELRDQLSASTFVDVHRLLIGPAEAELATR